MSSPRFVSKSELSAQASKLQKHLASKFDIHLKLTKVQHMLAEMEGYRGFDAVPEVKSSQYKGVKIRLYKSLCTGDFFEEFREHNYERSGILCVSDVLDRYFIYDEFQLDEIIRLLEGGGLTHKKAFAQSKLGHLTTDRLQWIPALLVLRYISGGALVKECRDDLGCLIERVEKINDLIGYKTSQGLILAKAVFYSICQPNQDALKELIKSTVRDFPVLWSSWVGVKAFSVSLPFFPVADDSISYSSECLVVGYPFWFREPMEEAAESIAQAYFSKDIQAYFLDNIDAFFFGRTEMDSSPLAIEDLIDIKKSLENEDDGVYCFMERTRFRVPESWD